jgi:hypothetical protein
VLGLLRNCSISLSFVLLLCTAAGCLTADTHSGRPRVPAGAVTVTRPPPAQASPVMGTAGTVVSPGTAGGGAAGVGAAPSTGVGGPQAGAAGMMAMQPGAPPPAGAVAPPTMRTFNAGSDPARNMVQAGQVCARLAQIQCAGEAYCCENPGRDVVACESKMKTACANDGYVDAITLDSRAGFDPARAATALQQFEDMASRCDPKIGDFGADPDGLMAMVRGTVASGGRCSPGVSSNMAAQAGALASCRDSATTACLPSSALTWTCAPRGSAGANCFTDMNCQDGLYCPNPDLRINMFKCLARKPDGMSCQEANECTSLTCLGGTCAAPTTQSAYCLD